MALPHIGHSILGGIYLGSFFLRLWQVLFTRRNNCGLAKIVFVATVLQWFVGSVTSCVCCHCYPVVHAKCNHQRIQQIVCCQKYCFYHCCLLPMLCLGTLCNHQRILPNCLRPTVLFEATTSFLLPCRRTFEVKVPIWGHLLFK